MRGIVAVIGWALITLAVMLILSAFIAFIDWRIITGFPLLTVGLYLVRDALSG